MTSLIPLALKILTGRFGLALAVAGALGALLLAVSLGKAAETRRADKADAAARANWTAAVTWAARARAWEASFRRAEQLRADERTAAVDSAGDAVARCDARVREARLSTAAIRAILEEKDDAPAPPGPDGRPVRQLIPAERLRDALAPGAGGP